MNGFAQALFVALVPKVSAFQVRFTRPRLFPAACDWSRCCRRKYFQPKALNNLVRYIGGQIAKIGRTTAIGMRPRHRVSPGKQKSDIHPQAVAIVLDAPLQYIVNFFVARNPGWKFSRFLLRRELRTDDTQRSRVHLPQGGARLGNDGIAETPALATDGCILERQHVNRDAISGSLGGPG